MFLQFFSGGFDTSIVLFSWGFISQVFSCVSVFLRTSLALDDNYIVMEYIPNGGLDQYLQKHQKDISLLDLLEMYSPSRLLKLLIRAVGACAGIHYLHCQEEPIIHRDISARNLLGILRGRRFN